MMVKKQKYRRLQVDNIVLRTIIEIVLLVTAVIISCVVVINSYEQSYAKATTVSFGESARQLAHSIAGAADIEALGVENVDRRAYVEERYSELLDSCFISEDISYSGAIYSVGETNVTLFAASTDFNKSFGGEENEFAGELEKGLKAAASGDTVELMLGDACVALEPVRNEKTGEIYAVAAAVADHRSSTEFDSPVKDRLVLISIVSGVLILVYFVISGARSEKKKINGEAV